MIELVKWDDMRPAFQKAIKKDLTLLSTPAQINPKTKL
jgi:hypothetical protein